MTGAGPTDGRNHYERLGVEARATTMQIRMAFRTLAKTHHPDAGGDTIAFRHLKEAHDCLVDPLRRKDYDAELGLRVAAAPVGSAERGWAGSQGGFTGHVEWPAYLRDVAAAPWQAAAPSEPDGDGAPGPGRPGSAGVATGPATVAWMWRDGADRDPVPAGPLVLLTAGRELAACEVVAGHELWRADLGRPAVVDPVVSGELVLASSGADLQAFDLGRGVLRWQHSLTEAPLAMVAVAGLVVLAIGTRLVAVDPATGKQAWSARLTGPAVQVGVAGDLVVVRTERSTLEGVDTRKGRHRFALKGVPPLQSVPVAAAGLVWVLSTGSRIVGLDPGNGSSAAALEPGLTVCGLNGDGSDSLLYATVAGPEEVLAIGRGGVVRWRAPLPCAALGPGLDRDHVYVVTGAQDVLTFDRTDGRLVAAARTEARPVADPVAVPGRVLVRDDGGTVWALSPPPPR